MVHVTDVTVCVHVIMDCYVWSLALFAYHEVYPGVWVWRIKQGGVVAELLAYAGACVLQSDHLQLVSYAFPPGIGYGGPHVLFLLVAVAGVEPACEDYETSELPLLYTALLPPRGWRSGSPCLRHLSKAVSRI